MRTATSHRTLVSCPARARGMKTGHEVGTRSSHTRIVIVAALMAAASGHWLLAQDLEPRSYSNSPTGLNFVLLGYGYTTGSVLTDPALLAFHVEAVAGSETRRRAMKSAGRQLIDGKGVARVVQVLLEQREPVQWKSACS